MIKTHILGFPRLGPNREYKRALEAYWAGKIDARQLHAQGTAIRQANWRIQAEAGLDYVTVGDFAWYDHVLNISLLAGVVPARFGAGVQPDLDTMFRMARGRAPSGADAPACEMTKWFNTNYHYIVPELTAQQEFKLSYAPLFDEVREAQDQGHRVKVVLTGPMTYLWLAKRSGDQFNKLDLLDRLSAFYAQTLERLKEAGAEWAQIDEPILALDLPDDWQAAFVPTYDALCARRSPNVLLTTYFGGLQDNLDILYQLPAQGIHLDALSGSEWQQLDAKWPPQKILSLGLIDGRNIWRADLSAKLHELSKHRGGRENLWIGSSCSLMHCPVDLDNEPGLDKELKQWLAFAKQKCREIALLGKGLVQPNDHELQQALAASARAAQARRHSKRIHKPEVAARIAQITKEMTRRTSKFAERATIQKQVLNLPAFPTTSIGSFPQTPAIRQLRSRFKRGAMSRNDYVKAMQAEIQDIVNRQHDMRLDVLVHGEPERNDMVEYFGELLDGMAVTAKGWVQSYGSRCVKPPIIYGDITRPKPMTVEWSTYAQSITKQPMKAMLTGPITILCWSFGRDDITRAQTARQLALVLRDEVADLEKNGLRIIQIDEPALREGLPLRQNDWPNYLEWAVNAFRLASSIAKDDTQIHSHMCYSEFNDIIEAIAALDADVISIECSRSKMELLNVFDTFKYPNDIGPGVYDIHSPLVPSADSMEALLRRATEKIPPQRLWVNPDCGLKTRNWDECTAALKNMVAAAERMRRQYA